MGVIGKPERPRNIVSPYARGPPDPLLTPLAEIQAAFHHLEGSDGLRQTWATRNLAPRRSCDDVADQVLKGPASYFPSIEKKYGRPVAEWQELVRKALPAKHMELVAMLKSEHGMGHGHANAIVAHTLAAEKA
jgi:hypothetical protein